MGSKVAQGSTTTTTSSSHSQQSSNNHQTNKPPSQGQSSSQPPPVFGSLNGNGGSGGVKSVKAESFQTEHEKFLEEFEKPTAIYRLIRARSLQNPRFLYRNLEYMENRQDGRRNLGPKLTPNALLERVERKGSETSLNNRNLMTTKHANYLNLVFLEFFDGQTWAPNTEAKVDIQILRLFVNRRKEKLSTFSSAFQSCCRLPVKSSPPHQQTEDNNYSTTHNMSTRERNPVIPIPKETFDIVNGHTVKSLKLAIRVTLPASRVVSPRHEDCLTNGNGVENDFEEEKKVENVGKPPTVSIGLVANGDASFRRANGHSHSVLSDGGGGEDGKGKNANNKRSSSLPVPTKDRENVVCSNNSRRLGAANNNADHIVYTGLLPIYDSEAKINIPADGNSDLDIRLTRQDGRRSLSKKRVRRELSWERALPADHNKIHEYLHRTGTVACPAKLRIALRATPEKMPLVISHLDQVKPGLGSKRKTRRSDDSGEADEEENNSDLVRVVYYFVRGSNPKQMTECRNDLRCPWCSINCIQLYSLLKHLTVCHPRFKFVFSPITNGARVDVSINETYDGSYTGSPFDLVAQPPGQAFGRVNAPSKRTQLFEMVTFKPKSSKRGSHSLQEFFDSESKNANQNRSYMIGHNRLYHHTTTCLPIHPREIDVDSEGEPDPEWLRVKTCMMIDEFTDVNEGEKEIMKMWNHHVMHENYVGDCQIPLACKKFVERFGQKIVEKNLYRNFILHVTNLYDFGLLTAQGFNTTVQQLHSMMEENKWGSSLKFC